MASISIHYYGEEVCIHYSDKEVSIHYYGEEVSIHYSDKKVSIHYYGEEGSIHYYGEEVSIHYYFEGIYQDSLFTERDLECKTIDPRFFLQAFLSPFIYNTSLLSLLLSLLSLLLLHVYSPKNEPSSNGCAVAATTRKSKKHAWKITTITYFNKNSIRTT